MKKVPTSRLVLLACVALVTDPLGSGSFANEVSRAEVTTLPASPLGITGMTVNGRIQPHGLSTRYWFEYGLDANYGKKSVSQPLAPKLRAYYQETWDRGLAGWIGGMSGNDLKHVRGEGERNGFIRYSEPSGDDANHVDGIGTLHLPAGVHSAVLAGRDGTTVCLGGGDPDLRDAIVELKVRGKDFFANGSELIWWTQSDIDVEKQFTDKYWRRANWAYTGYMLTDALVSGEWENVRFQLKNNSDEWTFAGNNLSQTRATRYAYDSINNSQQHLNTNFIFLLAFVNPALPPIGSIDFDDLTIQYRNYSLVYLGNGGKLISGPKDGDDDVARLTDGWRHGPGKMWRSVLNPKVAQEFVYQFASPATIASIQIHQHTEWPSKDLEILTSVDGANWVRLVRKDMDEGSPYGPNFSYLSERNLTRPAAFVKISVRSGYHSEHWGLGEIEIFGNGAQLGVDDDWYNVNLDIKDLAPGQRYYYRLVAENSAGKIYGPGSTYETPAVSRPHVVTREAKRVTSSSAVITGRLTPMGKAAHYHFEYGPDISYGDRTADLYGGQQEVPRLVFAAIDGLKPATIYHYRLVGANDEGSSLGTDEMFRTGAR